MPPCSGGCVHGSSLVLMDIRLPGIDGIEALRRLRAEQASRGIPIMAMTASVMTADRQRITDAGFDAYQSKPIKVKDFVAAVERSSTILENEEWSDAIVSSPL